MHSEPAFTRVTTETLSDGTKFTYYWNDQQSSPVKTVVEKPAPRVEWELTIRIPVSQRRRSAYDGWFW